MEGLHSFTACLWETTALRRDALEDARRAAWHWHAESGVVETCQRIEAFSLGECRCPAPARLVGHDAAEYLASLAAGLESAALGEYQVLGQVRAGIAPLRPRAPWLDSVIASARQLRSEAGFSASTGYLLDAGLDLAERAAKGSLLVIGAGAAGRDVARRGQALGFAHVAIASRREWNSEGIAWVPFGHMAAAGSQDVVVTCIGAGAAELTPEHLPPAGLYMDLGSPPNLSEAVKPAVTLHGIVQSVRGDPADAARRTALRRRLSDLLAARFAASRDDLTPVGRLRRDVEAIRAREAARIAKLHPGLPPETIDTITRALVNQLLHSPSERLRNTDDPELAGRLADLFAPPESSS